MKGKNLVTKALKGFNQARVLLSKAIESDELEIEKITTKITDLNSDKDSHVENKTYAKKVLEKLDALIA